MHIGEDVPYHILLRNYKLKQQRDITTQLSEGPKCKTQTTPNVSKDVGQQELSFLASRNAKKGTATLRQFGSFSPN